MEQLEKLKKDLESIKINTPNCEYMMFFKMMLGVIEKHEKRIKSLESESYQSFGGAGSTELIIYPDKNTQS